MKIALLSGVMFLAINAMAYEIQGNPDRFPSVGLNYTGTFLKGTGSLAPIPGFIITDEKDLKETAHVGMLDLRLPVNENITLNAGAGYAGRVNERVDASLAQNDTAIFGERIKDNLSGPTFNVGARYYFH